LFKDLFLIPGLPKTDEEVMRLKHIKLYSPVYYDSRENLWHQLWNKAIYVDVLFEDEDYYDNLYANRSKWNLEGFQVWGPNPETAHRYLSHKLGEDYMTPQDPACDNDGLICTAVTPVLCRRLFPFATLFAMLYSLWTLLNRSGCLARLLQKFQRTEHYTTA